MELIVSSEELKIGLPKEVKELFSRFDNFKLTVKGRIFTYKYCYLKLSTYHNTEKTDDMTWMERPSYEEVTQLIIRAVEK